MSMDAAISGLIGVVVGSVLTVSKEWWFQRKKERKDVEYLAIQVSCRLERYVAGCSEVVGDDGRPDQDGYYRCQVEEPSFDPELLLVEWKSLPTKLMAEVLDLPYMDEVAKHRVNGTFEEVAFPPDFDEGFEERQYQYATLGIYAAQLAADLRSHVGLPVRRSEEWDPVAHMKGKRVEIEDRRQARAIRFESQISAL